MKSTVLVGLLKFRKSLHSSVPESTTKTNSIRFFEIDVINFGNTPEKKFHEKFSTHNPIIIAGSNSY